MLQTISIVVTSLAVHFIAECARWKSPGSNYNAMQEVYKLVSDVTAVKEWEERRQANACRGGSGVYKVFN